ncbi:viral A-type inclusion protein [Dyadobacter sp. 32]|uniref:viral A-type inclusion protein n=1 Tax=Dyadobacter sp. 32 TaxID=538966 RepID=UPI0011EEFBB1
MKIKKIYLFALALSFSLSGCNGDKEKVLELETEVLALHDEVMPKQSEIMALKSKLSRKIVRMDSLQNEGITGNNLAEERMRAVDLNQKLNESDKLMMDWMHQYNGDSAKKLKPQQSLLYFENEKKKMIHVKEFTLKSIQDATSYLN